MGLFFLRYCAQVARSRPRAKPDYNRSRTRGLVSKALQAISELILTRPYVVLSPRQEVGLTMANSLVLAGDAVIGLDASVSELGGEAPGLAIELPGPRLW